MIEPTALREKRQPADQPARDRAVRDLDTCLVVEAGAGTGKTTLMVDRMLQIIRSGAATIDQILAITFTEKAASELRVRLRARLEQESRLAGGDERQRLRAALERFDQAIIDTIHALAGAILRERPVEARLDPSFDVLDELGESLAFSEAWDSWLDNELAGSPAAARRALNFGLDLRRIRRAAELLHEQRDLLPETWPATPPEPPTELIAWLRQEVEELKRLAVSCMKPEDGALGTIETVAGWAELAGRASEEGFERLLGQWTKLDEKSGNQANWRPKEDCAAAKAAFKEINRRLQDARCPLGQAATAALAGWLAGFVRSYELERRARGQALFQDLLVWARNLLRDDRPTRSYFQQRFRFVLVDEFQDTDPLQVEIVFYLAEGSSAAERWQDVQILPGKLFLVGDPKQAIYRFRRADIAVYEAARKAVLRSGGEALPIVQNFRSVEPLVSWVNRVFARVIGSGDLPYQPKYVPLIPTPPTPAPSRSSPVVALYPVETSDSGAQNAAETRRNEAGALARLVRRLVETEHWPVRDPQTGTIRPARYTDLALLFETTTEIEIFEDALRAGGVPYRVEGGRLFYSRQEVRDLVNCLAAVDDPTDRIALVAALCSPAFAFSDEELFDFVDGGNQLDYLIDPGPAWPRFQDAFGALRELHEQRAVDPPALVVEALLARTRLVELALLGSAGDQAAANLFKVIEQARSFGIRPGASFRHFVSWLRDNQRRPPREGDSPMMEASDDTARLLTVHSAKGLEFPIVLLANARSAVRPEECIVNRTAGTIDFRLGDNQSIFCTPDYEAAAAREALHAEAERRRLFYVACTRARDYLVVPLFSPDKGFAALVGDGVPLPGAVEPGGEMDGVLVYDMRSIWKKMPEPPPFRLLIGAGPEAEQALADRAAWQQRLKTLLRGPEGS